MAGRPPTSDEQTFVDTLLSHEFEGVENLRTQWSNAVVDSSCTCGCGSIGFVFAPGFQPSPSAASNPLPVEAQVVDSDGALIGGVIVLIRDGLLDDIDVHSFGDFPLSFPKPSDVRWLRRA